MITDKDKEAFNQVQATVAAMRSDYSVVCKDIDETQKHLDELPLLAVPLDDLKAAILDFVDARGQAYLDETVKPAIAQFATNLMGGLDVSQQMMGTPIRFKELESAADGTGGSYSNAMILTNYCGGNVSDISLYAVFGGAVKECLKDVMESMTEEDFGYDRIAPKQVGTDRVTRRAEIKAAQDRLSILRARKEDIKNSLFSLGVIVQE